MIELNLLPDVKMEYIKAQNLRRMAFTISALVAVVSIVLLGSLISVNQLQKKHLRDLTGDISKESAELKNKPQINKILTVQNQLNSLTDLHSTKPAAYNLFNYLYQVTPSNVSISSLHTDFAQYTINVTGSTETLSDVNKYIDTLKFTTYKTGDGQKSLAFGNVVLAAFGLTGSAQAGAKPASFTINLSYDPKIFDITQDIELTVPTKTTTRSSVDNPTDLFQAATPAAPATTTGGN
jgi:Tfp pilus assembly protein PilN